MRRLIAASLCAILALTLAATSALAHEKRSVGAYTFDVGWVTEPALAGQPNGVDLTVADKDGKPVEGLERSLTVDVSYGGLTRAFAPAFRALEGDPGHYVASFIPTKDGSYTFRLTGTVGSQRVDERFESGPNRFDDVATAASLQYPEPVPNGADLSERLAALQSGLDQLRVVAIVALVVALVGPIGATVLLRRRSA